MNFMDEMAKAFRIFTGLVLPKHSAVNMDLHVQLSR